ncbi:MAG: 16S rRNA (cytosine(1402)-N(4))-methyltransferase RsmH [Chloroflexi bacterium]|nr:16S rRNA (cytosine(1402)-N(4))-methyltransferase RsmH [Chloroflexota bacterium]
MVADLIIYHTPVLLSEVLEALQVQPGGRFIDCTLGEGGAAEALVAAGAHLLGLEADPEMIPVAARRLERTGGTYALVQANFACLAAVARAQGFYPAQGVLVDLGLSSRQLQAEERGFTFQQDQVLDMRYDPRQDVTAADLVNDLPEEEMADLFYTYGEEDRWSSQAIARSILHRRPLRTTWDLVQAVEGAVGQRSADRIHPATKVFMSLRLVINAELQALESVLPQAVELLAPGGRLVVIAYMSLESRVVKQFFQRESRDCLCPPQQPVCTCHHKATLRLLHRGVVTPSVAEIASNPASRSAHLRVIERLPLAAG